MAEMTIVKKVKKKTKKNKVNFLYLYIFVIVFLLAFFMFSYVVKSYSPTVDVAIGNNDTATFSDDDMNLEVKPIDERLKWIQMEDEMPSVALRNSNNKDQVPLVGELLPNIQQDEIESKYPEQEVKKVIPEPPVPKMSDIQSIKPDFRSVSTNISTSNVTTGPIPLPVKSSINQQQNQVSKPSITKVYLGSFSTIDEAMNIQQDILLKDSSLAPFIKAEGDIYFVQLGSFSEKERANALVVKMRTIGYYPKITTVN